MTVPVPQEKLRSFVLTQFSDALQKGLDADAWIVMQCIGMAVDNVTVDIGAIVHVTGMTNEEVCSCVEDLKMRGYAHSVDFSLELTSLGRSTMKEIWGE